MWLVATAGGSLSLEELDLGRQGSCLRLYERSKVEPKLMIADAMILVK